MYVNVNGENVPMDNSMTGMEIELTSNLDMHLVKYSIHQNEEVHEGNEFHKKDNV